MSINKKIFSKAASATDTFEPTKHFDTVLYTGTGATQKVGAYINQGAEFNGSNTAIVIPNNILNPNEHSVSVWFNLNTTSGIQTVVEFDFENRILYRAVSTDANKAYIGNSGYFNHGNSYSTNQWYHLVITFKAGSPYNIYVDGTNTNTGGNTSIAAFSNDNIIGASNSTGGSGFDGKIDQVRIFNKELTQTEVNTLSAETFDSATKSTTDIFGDRSGVALYQLDGNANDTGGASGYLNEGGIFNGSSSKVDITGFSNFGSTGVSISAWVNVNDFSTGPTILNLYSNNSIVFGTNSSGNFFRSGQGTTVTSTSAMSTNTWHNVVLTADTSGNVSLYLDGSAAGTGSSGTAMYNDNNQSDLIGAYGTIDQPMDGRIDEVRIYSDVLTATEVGHIYNNTTASIPTDNLEAYYKLDGTFQDEQQTHDGVGSNVIFRYDGTSSNVSFQGSLRFQPDLVWLGSRSFGDNFYWQDSVRGATHRMHTNLNLGDLGSDSTRFTSFDTNGFTVGSDNSTNNDSETFVAWCFRGAGAAVTNDTGSRDTQVSANTAAGFSIVSLNKPDLNTDTYGHGLTSPVEMIILKRTASSDDWHIYHKDLGNTVRISWNSTAQKVTGTGVWGSTTPTDSVFTLQNQLGGAHIAYCMHSVDNYQKIGSYTGNNSSSGPIVNTGFEIAFLMIKRADDTGSWTIYDNKRTTSNPRNIAQFNEGSIDNSYGSVHFLTNGFQITATQNNVNGGTYLYWAIAADPSTASTPSVTNAFDVVNYTGNGSTQEILTDTNPDFVWIKGTDTGTSGDSGNFVLFDTVRDAGSETDAPHFLASNMTNAEFGNANTGVVSFDKKGFTVTDDANGGGNVNGASGGLYSNGSYTAFLWSAGSHEENLPTINTDGAVESTVSVNDAAGFSIIKWTSDGGSTATTKGHGMSAAVDFAMVKSMDSNSIWMIFHKDLPQNKYIQFNTDALSPDGGTTYFTTSTTTLGFRDGSNSSSGDNMIAYAWREISGYSSVGTYTGNSSSTTVTTGFKPRWVMMKRTTAVGNWIIWDSINNPSADNDNNNVIYANLSNARSDAGSGRFIAFNSNGFTISGDSGNSNASGHTYLYFALA